MVTDDDVILTNVCLRQSGSVVLADAAPSPLLTDGFAPPRPYTRDAHTLNTTP